MWLTKRWRLCVYRYIIIHHRLFDISDHVHERPRAFPCCMCTSHPIRPYRYTQSANHGKFYLQRTLKSPRSRWMSPSQPFFFQQPQRSLSRSRVRYHANPLRFLYSSSLVRRWMFLIKISSRTYPSVGAQ
jgi:hypothetical protein